MARWKVTKVELGFAAQVDVRPAADQVDETLAVDDRIRIEAKITKHEAVAAPARQEAADDSPGHRRGRRQDLGEVVLGPNGAARFGLRAQPGQLCALHLLAFESAGRGDGTCLKNPELA